MLFSHFCFYFVTGLKRFPNTRDSVSLESPEPRSVSLMDHVLGAIHFSEALVLLLHCSRMRKIRER